MANPPGDRDETRADTDAAQIEHQVEFLRRRGAQAQTGPAVRRLVMTVITTALVALALWLSTR